MASRKSSSGVGFMRARPLDDARLEAKLSAPSRITPSFGGG